MRSEHVLFWAAVVFYGLSAFAYIFGFIARSPKLVAGGLAFGVAGFVPHTLSIASRWIASAATPFITIAESISLGVWMSVLLYLLVQLGTKKVRLLGVLVMPVVFVLIGWAATLRTAPASAQLAPALQSPWLWVHIVGASTGFSAVLIAAGLGLLFLAKERAPSGLAERIPDTQTLDDLSYRFVVGGFTMYGVMIVSGAFWANQAKGSFWNWDPVEVWSLVSWLIYGIYLHLRVTMGWRGQRLAIYSLVAVIAMIVSYWGIPFSMETFHSGFRIEH
jgi:cytochrome c-type biogenesis protein CcsB